MTTIYRYLDGYAEARCKVQNQPLADDLALIDLLYGRDALEYGATPEQVKEEALRQLEREYRSDVNELATLMVNVYHASKK